MSDQLVVQKASITVYSVTYSGWNIVHCLSILYHYSCSLWSSSVPQLSVSHTQRHYTSLTTLSTTMSHSPHNNFLVVHNCNLNSMSTLNSPIHSHFIMTITIYLLSTGIHCSSMCFSYKFGYFTEKTKGNKVVTVLNNF